MVLIYVDDILIMGSDTFYVQNCIQHLQQAFFHKDLLPLSYILGIEVHTTSLGLHLSQTKYLQNLLTRTNMHCAKPSPIHMAAGTSLFSNDSASFDNSISSEAMLTP